MDTKNAFISKFFDLLNKDSKYAVLRSFEKLPDNFDSHDIDILVDKSEFKNLKTKLYVLLKQEGYKVLMVNENERFNTLIIAKTIGTELKYLYLDFFFNFSLYGVGLVEAGGILDKRIFNGKIYHVSKMYEYLEKYLNCKLLNKHYPKKYKKIEEEVFDKHNDELNRTFNNVFGDRNITIESITIYSGKKLLFKAFMRNMVKRPVKQIKLSISFIYYHFKGKYSPNGFSFSITGPDGSGKTTILNALQKKLAHVYRETELHHFRPTVIPRIAELFKKTGLKSEVDVNYSQPHRGGETGKLSSFVRLFYYISDYIIGYYVIIKPVLFRRGVVIFDRYFTDIISDSRRSRINLNYKFIFSFRHLIPKLNYNFIIFVKPDIILERKQELTNVQIDNIYKKLHYICDKDASYFPIKNDRVPEVAIDEILQLILVGQDTKYAPFFKQRHGG